LKLLTYILLFYLVYRYFIQPNLLPPADRDPRRPRFRRQSPEPKNRRDEDEGEYIDYEEVD